MTFSYVFFGLLLIDSVLVANGDVILNKIDTPNLAGGLEITIKEGTIIIKIPNRSSQRRLMDFAVMYLHFLPSLVCIECDRFSGLPGIPAGIRF